MKVRVTNDAKADLRQIKAYISERNAIAADGLIDRIRKMLTLLADRLGLAVWEEIPLYHFTGQTFTIAMNRRTRDPVSRAASARIRAEGRGARAAFNESPLVALRSRRRAGAVGVPPIPARGNAGR